MTLSSATPYSAKAMSWLPAKLFTQAIKIVVNGKYMSPHSFGMQFQNDFYKGFLDWAKHLSIWLAELIRIPPLMRVLKWY